MRFQFTQNLSNFIQKNENSGQTYAYLMYEPDRQYNFKANCLPIFKYSLGSLTRLQLTQNLSNFQIQILEAKVSLMLT